MITNLPVVVVKMIINRDIKNFRTRVVLASVARFEIVDISHLVVVPILVGNVIRTGVRCTTLALKNGTTQW
jgi:hypothetical protein